MKAEIFKLCKKDERYEDISSFEIVLVRQEDIACLSYCYYDIYHMHGSQFLLLEPIYHYFGDMILTSDRTELSVLVFPRCLHVFVGNMVT